MSKIGTEEVTRLAQLARISLSPEETASMSVELGRILTFVDQLSAVDITGVEPTDQVTGLVDVWREDEVTPSLPRETLLSVAPSQKDGYILVKRVLGG